MTRSLLPGSLRGISFYQDDPADYLAKVRGRAPVPDAIWLGEHLSAPQLVVDAGCGVGEDTRYLRRQGLEVYAFDASQALLDLAQQADPGGVYHCHMHHELALPRPAAAILACASLIFLEPEDLIEAFAAFRQNLATNGLVLASFKRGRGVFGEPDGRRRHDFNLSDADDLANMAKMEIVEIRQASDSLGRSLSWLTFVLKKV